MTRRRRIVSGAAVAVFVGAWFLFGRSEPEVGRVGRDAPDEPLTEQAARCPALGDETDAFLTEWAGRSLDRWRTASASGDSDGKYLYGLCLTLGRGTAKNPDEGTRLIREAADAGQPQAQLAVARALLAEPGADPAKAAALLREAADRGEPVAAFELALLYEAGRGVPRDRAAATEYLLSAAADGVPAARRAALRRVAHLELAFDAEMLDWVFAGCERNEPEALFLAAVLPLPDDRRPSGAPDARLRASALAGFAPADYELGVRARAGAGPEARASALTHFRKAAGSDWVPARIAAAVLLRDGTPTEREDAVAHVAAARRVLVERAEHGTPDDRADYGEFLLDHGDELDFEDATAVLFAAAEEGNARARYRIAMAALGSETDGPGAVRWLRLAAGQGHAGAQFELGVSYQTGRHVAADPGEAVRWFRKAAEQDHPGAVHRLGKAYETGAGVPKDAELGAKLLQLARELGHRE